MRSPVQDMLDAYGCRTLEDYRSALKEIVQEIALLGLYRSGFFRRAAFYGGTALRIFHGLDRFSEDLDFSLLEPSASFELEDHLPAVRDELGAYGFEMTVEKKRKGGDSAVQSAFIKGGTMIHLARIAALTPPVAGVPANELLKIKFEVDTDPPAGATTEIKYQLLPVSFSVRLYDPPSLFAGKLHALLCRDWKNRVKGRDFHDYLWYLARKTPVNMAHLEARLRQSGHWTASEALTMPRLATLLLDRFAGVDMAQAIADVKPFVRDPRALELWSPEFFMDLTRDRLR